MSDISIKEKLLEAVNQRRTLVEELKQILQEVGTGEAGATPLMLIEWTTATLDFLEVQIGLEAVDLMKDDYRDTFVELTDEELVHADSLMARVRNMLAPTQDAIL